MENTETVPVNEQATTPNKNIVNKGDYTIETVTFGPGKKEGFSFCVPAYNTYEAAVRKLGQADGKTGAELEAALKEGSERVMGILNGAVRQQFANRAGQRMPAGNTEADTANLIKLAKEKNETLLITEKDADEWVPGTRDRVSLTGLIKAFMDACKAGNIEEAEALKVEIAAEQNRKFEEAMRLATAVETTPATA